MVEIGREAVDALGLHLDLCPSFSGRTYGIVSMCGHTAGPSLIYHSSLQGRRLPRKTWEGLRSPVWSASSLPGFQGCTAALCEAHLFQELSYLLSSSLLLFLRTSLSPVTALLEPTCYQSVWFCWESEGLCTRGFPWRSLARPDVRVPAKGSGLHLRLCRALQVFQLLGTTLH